jgi:membrane-bound lytic murein transglycosylase D
MRFLQPLSLILLLGLISYMVAAQAPQVPHKMRFADITLSIRDDARKEIQKDVDAMTLSPKHFNIKSERAKTYFPIIEKVFAEENVPDDFKFLVLQESALIADAVSPSNAVGFWQFKDFTAIEMGLRVDKEIDERMNIVSASRGAAKYFKKNNMFFDNWLYALQAYQMGAGAVMQLVKDDEHGVKHMEVTSKTYWYVKKFLAHKIAFEQAVSGPAQVQITTFENKGKRSLSDLAKEVSIEEEILRSNNKWIKNGTVPDDKAYMIVIPVTGNINDIKVPTSLPLNIASTAKVAKPGASSMVKSNRINGLATIVALQGETPTILASRAAVELSTFLKWNDISISDPVKAGQVYFISRKRTRAIESYHTVKPGEDLWTISQQYGVQLKKLRKYNRLESNTVQIRETLWLSAKRPKDSEQMISTTPVAEVNNKDTFNWSADADVKPTPEILTQAVEPTVTVVVTPTINDPLKVTQSVDSLENIEIQSQPALDSVKMLPLKDSITSFQVSIPNETISSDTFVNPPPEKKTEHIVQPKETLYAIANMYHVGVMDLVNWNHLNLQEGIKPGQHLKLFDEEAVKAPETASVQPSQLFHEVKTTDTLYSVARKYGVTIKDLMDWNGKKDFSLTVGEKLKIMRH